jgi:hypothetical protein
MKKVLVAGDSFACSHKSETDNIGWSELLKQDYEITNLAQAGVSEYKIYKQLESIDIRKFDNIIICHTSFFRIPIEEHPIYKTNKLHKNCDLIFTDVESKKGKSKKMKIAYEFFKEFFWDEYFIFSNSLIFEKIFQNTKNNIHITFFDNFYDNRVLNLKYIFENYRGDVNHLNKDGNTFVFETIKKLIE